MLEFGLAYLVGVKNIAYGAVFGIGLAAFFVGVGRFVCLIEGDEKQEKWFRSLHKGMVIPGLIAALLASVPSVEGMWKVRIGLIKFHLASPENVQKGAEEIIRIGKKLECKYIGCDEEKKK